MGLLDSIVGGLMNNAGGGGGGGMQGMLMNMLSGNSQQGMAQQQPGYAQGGGVMGGGLGGLVSAFEQAGMGSMVQSWIGNGSNQSVSPQQLQTVFGHDQVQSMASQAGMEPHDFLSQLSQHLPNAVNAMTPNGTLPEEGSVSV